METMENINRLLLQNVLPLHVASFFLGKAIRNQVKWSKLVETQDAFSVRDFVSVPRSRAKIFCMPYHIPSVCFRTCTVSHMTACV